MTTILKSIQLKKGDFVTRYSQIVTKDYLDELQLDQGQPIEFALNKDEIPNEVQLGFYEGHDSKQLHISKKSVVAGNKFQGNGHNDTHMFHFATYGPISKIPLKSIGYFLAFDRPDYREYVKSK
jgi:hypothetical protein